MKKKSKRILIVDDEENLTWSLTKNLKREYKDHEVYSVTSGEQALEILKRYTFDLIISDVRMPGVDGLVLLGYIRQYLPHAKVILMTSLNNPDLKKIADGSNVFFFEKPFDIVEFKKTIQHLLSNFPSGDSDRTTNPSILSLIKKQYSKQFSGIVNVKNGNECGSIYFDNGKIIHANTSSLEGEMALINILYWKKVSFEIYKKDINPGKQTIYYGWKLLEKDLILTNPIS